MKNQQRDLLGMRMWWLFPNQHWHAFFIPTDCRGHGVFGTRLAGWYEQDLTLLFVCRADRGPLSGSRQGDWDLTLMFVGGSNRGPLVRSLRGSTPPSLCCPNPSSLDFWIGFFYNFDITKILVIFVSRGRGEKFLVTILCITIVPVGIPVPSRRGCFRNSLSGPWRSGGLQNYGRTASLSASQHFNIIVWGVSVCTTRLRRLGHHPRTCVWRLRLPLFRFDPFCYRWSIHLFRI